MNFSREFMESKKAGYLNNVSLGETLKHWLGVLSERGILDPLPAETISVDESRCRVTAAPIFARTSSPYCNCSAMDGYVVRCKDTLAASKASPLRLVLGKDAIEINTGDPVPETSDAVIMIEDVDQVSAKEIEITAPATPWQNIRTVGEDIVATEPVLPENALIDPVGVAALLAAGLVEIPVRRRPVVTVIPTGSELVQPGEELRRGNIIESNSRLLAGMAAEWGALAMRREIVKDDFAQIETAIKEASACSDVVLVNAGSSAGSADYAIRAIETLGEVLVRGVRIRPGKAAILGIVDNKPVLGIPGYPVSAALAMDLFAQPVIFAMQGLRAPARTRVQVRIPKKVSSSSGTEEFVRVKIAEVGELLVAAPIERSAGALMSLAGADGILRIPEYSEDIKPETKFEVELLRNLNDFGDAVVAVGSHDITLDIIASDLRKKHPGLTLSSINTGGMGGLMAMNRGEAHLAAIRLLDQESGEYNSSFVKKYLPASKISLVNIAFREKGLIVRKGNPKGIQGIQDLTRNDVVFINRQKGTGTRILLDYKLGLKEIEPEQIAGYEREEDSHIAVAAAIQDGTADAGMGLPAAARALDLDFVPVTSERYDLAIPEEFLEKRGVGAILEIIGSAAFRDKVLALGGYDTSRSGEVVGQS